MSSFLWHILQDQLIWTAWLKISFALTTNARMILDYRDNLAIMSNSWLGECVGGDVWQGSDVTGFYALQLCKRILVTIKPSVRPSVRLSVRLSVTRVYCDKTNESSANIVTPYERSVHLVFWHEEWLVGDVPFNLKFWTKRTLPISKTRLNPYT